MVVRLNVDVGECSFDVVSGSFTNEETVLSKCYFESIVVVEVTNPTTCARTESVDYSSDVGGKITKPCSV